MALGVAETAMLGPWGSITDAVIASQRHTRINMPANALPPETALGK